MYFPELGLKSFPRVRPLAILMVIGLILTLILSRDVPDSFYYRDLSYEFENLRESSYLELYNQVAMDRDFAQDLRVNTPPPPLLNIAFSENIDELLRVVFHLDDVISWRWPEPGERIYHRPRDEYVGVWLEHLRFGFHPRCHQFLKDLCKYQYEIPVTQITLNDMKWISWFLGACNKSNYLPTYKLFYHLFRLVHSTNTPLYEFRFRAKECGYDSSDAKPVMMAQSLKWRNREFLFLKGLDLEYMPLFSKAGAIENFQVYDLRGEALTKVHDFCEGLGTQLTRDSFMNYRTLYGMGCLPSYNPEYQIRTRMSQPARDLAVALKNLGGVYDLNTKNNEFGGENSTRGAPESGTGGALTVVEEFAEGHVSLKKRKKQDIVLSKFGNMNVDVVVERSPRSGGSGKDGSDPVANIGWNFAGFLSELPTEAEWAEMGKQGATTVIDEVVGVYGQLGVRIAGAANLVREELKELETLRNSSSLMKDKDDVIQKLQDKFNSLKTSVGSRIEGMKESLKVAEEGRKTAESRAHELTQELVGVQSELQSRKSEKKIIDEFSKSSKYSEELADAAATKIQRCWVVAERHIKTDPGATFNTFCDLYVAAEETVANGGGEPEPYTGSTLAVPDDDA